VYYEIKNSNLEKKLIAGIVLTGGGAQLKHVAQLTSFITGMDTRIGYPNEHLASSLPEEIVRPMYATGVGLVMIGLDRIEREQRKKPETDDSKPKQKRKLRINFFDQIKGLFDEE
jgi:cell division protein FtsA